MSSARETISYLSSLRTRRSERLTIDDATNLTAEMNRLVGRLAVAIESIHNRNIKTNTDWAAQLRNAQALPAEDLERLVWRAESLVTNTDLGS